jgi:hypothetical protein
VAGENGLPTALRRHLTADRGTAKVRHQLHRLLAARQGQLGLISMIRIAKAARSLSGDPGTRVEDAAAVMATATPLGLVDE